MTAGDCGPGSPSVSCADIHASTSSAVSGSVGPSPSNARLMRVFPGTSRLPASSKRVLATSVKRRLASAGGKRPAAPPPRRFASGTSLHRLRVSGRGNPLAASIAGVPSRSTMVGGSRGPAGDRNAYRRRLPAQRSRGRGAVKPKMTPGSPSLASKETIPAADNWGFAATAASRWNADATRLTNASGSAADATSPASADGIGAIHEVAADWMPGKSSRKSVAASQAVSGPRQSPLQPPVSARKCGSASAAPAALSSPLASPAVRKPRETGRQAYSIGDR